MTVRDRSGRLLAGVLTVLLTVPLAVSVHHHEAEHDGRVAHLELPHGGHDSPAPELYERITSGGFEGLTVPLPSQAPALRTGQVLRAAFTVPEGPDHPARPPPTPPSARAPPPGSPSP